MASANGFFWIKISLTSLKCSPTFEKQKSPQDSRGPARSMDSTSGSPPHPIPCLLCNFQNSFMWCHRPFPEKAKSPLSATDPGLLNKAKSSSSFRPAGGQEGPGPQNEGGEWGKMPEGLAVLPGLTLSRLVLVGPSKHNLSPLRTHVQWRTVWEEKPLKRISCSEILKALKMGEKSARGRYSEHVCYTQMHHLSWQANFTRSQTLTILFLWFVKTASLATPH